MDQQRQKKRFLHRATRIALKAFLYTLIFLVLIVLLIQTPPVQNLVRKKAVTWMEKRLDTRVEVGKVSISFPQKVILEDVYVEDRQKDTLLAGGSLKANINLFDLIFRGTLDIKKLALEDITLKASRTITDSVFNYQFFLNAFAPQDKVKDPRDTTTFSIGIPELELDKVSLVYKDVQTGSDMHIWVNHLDANIENFEPVNLIIDVPTLNVDGMIAKVYHLKPLAAPEPMAKDIIEATEPVDLRLDFEKADLKNINIDYRNDVSAFYSNLNIGSLQLKPQHLDIANQVIELDSFTLHNSTAAFRFGRKEEAAVVVEEIKQELESRTKAGWRIKINSLDLADNSIVFDNDNNPRTQYGIDYAHFRLDSFSLMVDDFLFDSDSVGGNIRKGNLREKNGFVLNELSGDVLFARNQAYLKDLILRTPGTELKRFASLTYNSYKTLNDSFSRVMMNADISNSRVQVKDILAFAPSLRSQPAFANREAIWYIDLQGSGTLNSLYVENLQFRGLKNTSIDAKGSIAAASDPNRTGARLTIRDLHTTQSDIALFTGKRLSNAQLNLPEEFDMRGTLAGSVNNLSADIVIGSSAGTAVVNGRFTNLANPNTATYIATVKTNSLQLGSILRNPQLGILSADLDIAGKGFRPASIDTKFKGTVHAVDFNDYIYRNISLTGNLRQSAYTINTDMNDPNIALHGIISGDLSENPSFRFDGVVDSLKAMPLNLTTRPLVFRGNVKADIPVMNANVLEANVLITNALFVSASQRLPLDTIQFISGRNDSVHFMSLMSDVATARINGMYRYTDLGRIIQNSVQPYFSVSPAATVNDVQPYDFTFNADIAYAPVLTAFVPGLESFEPIHAEGSLATGRGLTGTLTTSRIIYNGNDISGLNLSVNTTSNGLEMVADVQRLKGAGLDLYHTRLNAIALNNKIDFDLDIDDIQGRDRYKLSGLFSQPSTGTYTLNLHPDSLILNYESWSVLPGNTITITKDNIIADNFTIQRNDQKLTLQTVGQELNANFENFQISTITSFMQSDTLGLNGSMTGVASFKNILRQPVFTSDLTIRDLSMKGDTIGNAAIKVDNIGNRYNTAATITGRGNDISLTGSFSPKDTRDIALDLNLNIRQLQLATVEGAFGGFLKNASGAVNGDITIRGTLAQPIINGPLNFDKASFALSVLGSQFRVDGEKLMVTENGFTFDDFVIRDTANNIMRLNGVIQTPNFTNFFFDLDLYADNFRILHTTKKQNKIYYGDLVITAELHVDGTEEKPIVDGDITVNNGTELTIVIPQREPGIIQREGIVEFIDMDNPQDDSLFSAYDSLNVSPFVGMDITTNIEIQKDAIFNIVIDEANGDFINLQGEAVLSTGIDPSGKITLVGSYEIERGSYNITFSFLSRKFDIEKGSKIVWLNEPTRATLDVSAVYIANTSPIDLVQQQISASSPTIRNTYLQKLPFQVKLYMTGELLQPKVNFDIVLPENQNYGVSNDIIIQVERRLAELREDPGEINKQVFSLLLLNRFVGENPFASSTPFFSASSYARQSVSRLLTDQLNKLASDLIDGVDVSFDITSTDDYTTGERRSRTDLNVGLSKRLLNERLTVTVGSNFELQGPKGSNQKASNILGNVAVNYSISRDGRYMIRFYRKNEYEAVVDGYIIESGLSFIISVDYDNIRELFRRKRNQTLEGVQK
jgi:translocation and assembly module TamB